MGRGDKKSRQGKIWRGSHGKRRPKKHKHGRTAAAGAKSRKSTGAVPAAT